MTHSPKHDIRYNELKDKVDDVKELVADNISLVINRGNTIDNIIRDTEDLVETSTSFRSSVKKLKWNICKKEFCYSGILCLFVCFILVIITYIFCGYTFTHCKL